MKDYNQNVRVFLPYISTRVSQKRARILLAHKASSATELFVYSLVHFVQIFSNQTYYIMYFAFG